ncbi:MAG: pyridoxamine 5'-phosphate oxidase family protein [Acidimicrobiia bacterium]
MGEHMRWAELEAAAPELAARGRSLIERLGFVFVGTIRRDGSPRISPVEAHLVGGQLMLVMIPGTRKARDVGRDSRVVLQSPITDAADPGHELKLWGRAVEVDDRVQREATADQIETVSGWRPDPSWSFLALEIESAVLMEWRQGEMLLTRWDRTDGLQPPERRRLDPSGGRYASIGA